MHLLQLHLGCDRSKCMIGKINLYIQFVIKVIF